MMKVAVRRAAVVVVVVVCCCKVLYVLRQRGVSVPVCVCVCVSCFEVSLWLAGWLAEME